MPFLRIFMKVCRSKSRKISSAVTTFGWLPRQQNTSYKGQRTGKEIPSYRKHDKGEAKKKKKGGVVTRQKENSSLLLGPTCRCHSWEPPLTLSAFPPKEIYSEFSPLYYSRLFPLLSSRGKVKIWQLSSCCRIWQMRSVAFFCLWNTLFSCKRQSRAVQAARSGHRKMVERRILQAGLRLSGGSRSLLWVWPCMCGTDMHPGIQQCLLLCPSFPPSPGDTQPVVSLWQWLSSLHSSFSPSCSSSMWSSVTLVGIGMTMPVGKQAVLGGCSQCQAQGWQVLGARGVCLCARVCTYPGKSLSHTAWSCSWQLLVSGVSTQSQIKWLCFLLPDC